MRKFLFGVLTLVLGTAVACDAGTSSSQGIDGSAVFSDQPLLDDQGHPLLVPNADPGVAVFETELLRLVNDYRLVMGLQPLVPSTKLGDAARAFTRNMIERRFFNHSSPEGLSPGARLALANVDWTAVGENIASGYSTPQDVFEAWMASPKHRANIESDRFTHAGVGYSLDPAPTGEYPETHFWAMAFLRR
jgi:uncharacterized protein YkwD